MKFGILILRLVFFLTVLLKYGPSANSGTDNIVQIQQFASL